MADWADSGGHWYKQDGTPAYTMLGANGVERPTTLRDARKLGLVPSVTGIIRCAAAPQLQRWIVQQAVLSALTLPRIDGESSDAFVERVEQDRQEQVKKAAERGTAIHAAIEKSYRGEFFPGEFLVWDMAVKEELLNACGEQVWHPERSFASKTHSYGGKTDLHSDKWVIDIKGIDKEAPTKLYDEHTEQLAAYREGLNIPGARCGILFVQRERPEATFVEASEDELVRGMKMFLSLLSYWKARNRVE